MKPAPSNIRQFSRLFPSNIYKCISSLMRLMNSTLPPFTMTNNNDYCSFFPTLIEGRNLESSSIRLSWLISSSDGTQYSKILLQLPMIDKLTLAWVSLIIKVRLFISFQRGASTLLDESTLLHLARNTNQASLCSANCTVSGITNAFEVK